MAGKKMSPFLHLISGPMFSGKSSRLLEELNRGVYGNIKQLYINSKIDTRSKESFSCHNPFIQLNDKVPAIKVSKLSDVPDEALKDIEIIGIDEAQFFEDLTSFVIEQMKKGKHIIVAGLESDFEQKKFGQILDLIPHSHKYERLTGYCMLCTSSPKKQSIYSIRNNEDHEKIKVGGAESYIAVCFDCFHQLALPQ